MIFVTTGTQLAFERLVKGVDEWAEENSQNTEVFAQIGKSKYKAKAIETKAFLNHIEYEDAIKKTTLLVGHAGTGTIITAHDYSLPLIIMPRLFKFGEHRNDHQVATVTKFKDTPGVYVANNTEELKELLDRREKLTKCGEFKPKNREKLIEFLINEIKNQ